MSLPSTTHLETLRLAHPLRVHAAGLATDANEALFFVHSALLAAFRKPAASEASLRAHIDRRAADATALRAAAKATACS